MFPSIVAESKEKICGLQDSSSTAISRPNSYGGIDVSSLLVQFVFHQAGITNMNFQTILLVAYA